VVIDRVDGAVVIAAHPRHAGALPAVRAGVDAGA
jgi:hypothetical protein